MGRCGQRAHPRFSRRFRAFAVFRSPSAPSSHFSTYRGGLSRSTAHTPIKAPKITPASHESGCRSRMSTANPASKNGPKTAARITSSCLWHSSRRSAGGSCRRVRRDVTDEFPYHRNWRAGQVHPAYLLVSTSLDHVEPGGRGGNWLDEGNHVSACCPCNTGKADLRLQEVGWTLLSTAQVRSDWDGLANATNELWQRAGKPDIYREWRRALSPVP